MLEKLRFSKLEMLIESWGIFLLAQLIDGKWWRVAFLLVAIIGFILSWRIGKKIKELEELGK